MSNLICTAYLIIIMTQQDLDRMTRKQLCMNRMLAKKADVERIYLPYQEDLRSLMNLEKEYKATMIGLRHT